MRRYTINFTFVTPCISAGANHQKAELRVPEIRAQLRTWARIGGLPREKEDELFGALGKKGDDAGAAAGRITVRCTDMSCSDIRTDKLVNSKYDYFLWPFFSAGGVNHRPCLDAGGMVELEVLDRTDKDKEAFRLVLERFLLLGSMGSRSRRGYGSVYPTSVISDDGWNMVVPQTVAELKETLKRLELKQVRILSLGGFNDYKSAVACCARFLHNARCGSTMGEMHATEWGERDKNVVKNSIQNGSLTRPAIGLPMPMQFKGGGKYSVALKDCDGDRWASPIVFKVVKLRDAYVPLAIFLKDYCMPEGTELQVSGNGRKMVAATSSRELFDVLASPEKHGKINFSGASILFDC